jgi:hypothetical protein
VSLHSDANAIFHAVRDDGAAQAKIRAEFKRLAVLIATDPSASARITSATIDGQTFSSQAAMTEGQRLNLLRRVVACLDAQSPISKTVIPYF